jgi:hypothetical protein
MTYLADKSEVTVSFLAKSYICYVMNMQVSLGTTMTLAIGGRNETLPASIPCRTVYVSLVLVHYSIIQRVFGAGSN